MKGSEGPRRWDDADLHPPNGRMDPRHRVFGAPFQTAGWVVIAVTAVVAGVEFALFALLLRL